MHDVRSTVQKMSGAVQDVFGGSEGVCCLITSYACIANPVQEYAISNLVHYVL